MNAIPANCKSGSAWHTWQLAGYDWRIEHPDASIIAIRRAATDYADTKTGLMKEAVHRAFAEGACIMKTVTDSEG